MRFVSPLQDINQVTDIYLMQTNKQTPIALLIVGYL